jgi:hypothetical protein
MQILSPETKVVFQDQCLEDEDIEWKKKHHRAALVDPQLPFSLNDTSASVTFN